jgi:UDP-glucose 4-epimerase
LSVGRRVLVTGLGSFWGGRVAQALESDPSVELIVGLDTTEPTVQLERTEFVRADQSYSILSRIVQATQVDTIAHTFLVVDSTRMSGRALHEINVIGTMNLLAAAGAPESSVRHLVVKSSTLVYGASHRDPNWFREDMTRTQSAGTRVERSLLEVESYLRDFADDSPNVTVAMLRCGNVLGTDIVTPISQALSLPVVPSIFGFDPLMQFVEEDDVVRALEFAMRENLSGVYNVAGDGRLPWSEVASMVGRPLWPLPPVLTALSAAPLTRLGVVHLPDEILDLLRYGRGVDNRRLKQAGFEYRYTSVGAVESFLRGHRLRKVVGKVRPEYKYERDVEAFFRHSPAVIRPDQR